MTPRETQRALDNPAGIAPPIRHGPEPFVLNLVDHGDTNAKESAIDATSLPLLKLASEFLPHFLVLKRVYAFWQDESWRAA